MKKPSANPDCQVCRGTGVIHESHGIEGGMFETLACDCVDDPPTTECPNCGKEVVGWNDLECPACHLNFPAKV